MLPLIRSHARCFVQQGVRTCVFITAVPITKLFVANLPLRYCSRQKAKVKKKLYMDLAPAHPHLSGRCVCLFSCDTLPDSNTPRRWRMLIRRDVLLSFLMRNCTVKAFLCNQLHNTPPETRRAARRGVYPLGRRRDSGLLSTRPCTRSLACRPPVRHTHTRTHTHTVHPKSRSMPRSKNEVYLRAGA